MAQKPDSLVADFSEDTITTALVQKKYPLAQYNLLGSKRKYRNVIKVGNDVHVITPYQAFQNAAANQEKTPYLILPDDEYEGFLKQHSGFAGEDSALINFNNKKVLVFKSSEINSNIENYKGTDSTDPYEVQIDGQKVIFKLPGEFEQFLKIHSGISGMPRNYILVNGEVIVVLPLNPSDYEHNAEMRKFNIHNEDRNNKPADEKGNFFPTQQVPDRSKAWQDN